MPIMRLFYLPDWMAPTLSSVRFPNVCQSFLSRQKVKDSCCRCPPLTPLTPLTLFLSSKVMTALVDLRESADKSNKQKINPASYSSPEPQSQASGQSYCQ